ncbi:MAG: hypoxanthine phosphoribosyltransferase [Chloroflexi bacterium]|nr:hypoxanthine phosphoribosyltransferase [Chloroflexota bacterium]
MIQPHWRLEQLETFITEEQIQQRVAELGAQISEDYRGKDLLLVAILKGSVVFLADLMRHITIPHSVDFMATSSYGAATRSAGIVRILKDLDIPILDRNVLIVEDIVDTGHTLNYLRRMLLSREPASLRVVTLLDKRARREVDVPLDYVGFEVPNAFVIGYGLDYAEFYRNLPYIAIPKEGFFDEPPEE